MEKKTQISVLKNHLQKYSGITSKEAFEKYGITRLSGQIFILRERGMNIETEIRPVKNRYGGMSQVAFYKLMD